MPTLHVSEPTHTMHAVPKPTDAPKAPNAEPASDLDGGIVATLSTTLFASEAGPPPPDPTGGKLAPETPIPIEGSSACAHLAVDEGYQPPGREYKNTQIHARTNVHRKSSPSLAKLSDKFEA